jgi:Cellulase (glycosyl hydrolase family 5)
MDYNCLLEGTEILGSPYTTIYVRLTMPTFCFLACLFCLVTMQEGQGRPDDPAQPQLSKVCVSSNGRQLIAGESGRQLRVWGVNYDHDANGRLIEDYWHENWSAIEEDFAEIKQLGANTVRIHLQLGKFMNSTQQPNDQNVAQLQKLVKLAERLKLYLDITGLGCYHKSDVPPWYDQLSEAERWSVQTRFWETVAAACQESPAVLCYDLMNEPILPGDNKPESDWLAGEFAGKHFVQRISLNLAGRTREQVAKLWIDQLVEAIRKHDSKTLITVGVIPWAHVWPKAKPIFYSAEASAKLDLVSIHLYPKKKAVDGALAALAVYDIGKPLIIEEMFPLECSLQELDQFIEGSKQISTGWIGFYWGKTANEYRANPNSITDSIIAEWIEYFRSKSTEMTSER